MFIVNHLRKRTFYHTIIPAVVKKDDKEQITDGESKVGVGSVENLEVKPEPIEFSVTFQFKIAEDLDYVELRDKAENKKELITYDENNKETKQDMGTWNAFLYILRTSLVEVNGIFLPGSTDEKPLPLMITKEDGSIDVECQKAVFEAIRVETELFDKIILAFQGLNSKN